jgi:hypothetical protein
VEAVVFVPWIAVLCLPCALLIAALFLATHRGRYEAAPSPQRFQRQVLRYLEPRVRPKSRGASQPTIAILPRFTQMHLQGPVSE